MRRLFTFFCFRRRTTVACRAGGWLRLLTLVRIVPACRLGYPLAVMVGSLRLRSGSERGGYVRQYCLRGIATTGGGPLEVSFLSIHFAGPAGS
ncbi:hypothetical protein B296_00014237 [Ensete ventricosum]|uniref:Uncharacterized protein n=1 Tax=Ensete ventricosum TaxID=4639 RepID=A0A426YI26_ENSVE|nr:hypothetical protein B296_00014237 [Ensete ventricosum]